MKGIKSENDYRLWNWQARETQKERESDKNDILANKTLDDDPTCMERKII